MGRPRWRIERGGQIAIGPGRVDLLEAIGREGSISGAARALGMSYRRAWLLVEATHRCFKRPLIVTSTWRGRGAALTREGREVIRLYRTIQTRSLRAASPQLGRLGRLLKRAPGKRPSTVTR